MDSSITQNRWVNRTVTLGTSAMARKSINYLVLENNFGPAGQYDVMVADITVTSPDGTVTTLLGRGETGSATGNLGICNAVNSSPTFPVTCLTEQVTNTTLAAALPSTIFTLSDHLGSASMEFAQGGWPLSSTQFMPYGQEMPNPQGTTDNHYKFTGKERDADSGLDYFGARYYASSMGRWMSPDWSAKEEPVPYAKLDDPQSLNLYGYVGNNPLSKDDPDGQCPWCIGAAIGVIAEVGFDLYTHQDVTARKVFGAAVGGAIAGASGGLGLEEGIAVRAAIASGGSIIGGITERTIKTGSLTRLRKTPRPSFVTLLWERLEVQRRTEFVPPLEAPKKLQYRISRVTRQIPQTRPQRSREESLETLRSLPRSKRRLEPPRM